MGAAATMLIPQVAPDGVRQTVNAYVTPAQATWNVRSAFNVAALNCLAPQHANILENYKVFLENFDKPLDKANDKVEAEFRDKYGDRRTGRAELDNYMTKVYNYFTMPPAKQAFCDAALELSNESVLVAPADLESFSARALTRFEGVFEDFFRSFERYQTNLATWDRLYGTPAGLYPSYGPTTQVADNDTMTGNDGRVLLNAPVDNPGGQSVTLPQTAQSVDVAPSTAATQGDQQQPETGGIVLPGAVTASTAGDLQGPAEPDPSR